jgi:hypothetical protein
MRFLILRKADLHTERGVMPGDELRAAMGSYHQQLTDAGVMRDGAGIRPSAEGVRLRLGHGAPVVAHGPFPDSELVAGFSVFEADSREQAIEWIKRWPAQDGDGELTIEVRESGCAGGCAEVRASSAAAGGGRYIVLLRSSSALEAELPVAQEVLDRLDAHNAAEAAKGVLLAADGLRSSARAARVHFKAGKASVLDGPFTEIKELIAGYWLIRAESLDDAIEWAKRNPYPTGPKVDVEIRPLYEPEDFAPAFTTELRAAEERMRAAQLEAGLHARLPGAAPRAS